MADEQKAIYRIAVVSDIHAHGQSMDITSGKEIPSWVSQTVSSAARHRNPLPDLTAYVRDRGITADILVCPGDISDKADDAALIYAWNELQEIAKALNVGQIVGAVGNHDLHSHSPAPMAATLPAATASPLPNAKIRELTPTFPLNDPNEFRRYWSDHVALYNDEHCRIVTLNSCASHGYIFEGSEEYLRGRFTEEAETKLIELITECGSRPINILLTHHHPQTITELQFSDSSTMLRGDRLLRLLGSGNYGSWMVIHGHRHVPFFQLGPGDNDRPYVFSAGSVGVILHPLFYPTKPPNQFYVVEFDLTEINRRQSGLFGFLNAWNWNLGNGWQQAADNDTIPARSGFGNRTPAATLARQVAELIKSKAQGQHNPFGLFEQEVMSVWPDVAFLLPSERERFKTLLEQEGVFVGRDPRHRSRLLFVYTRDEVAGA